MHCGQAVGLQVIDGSSKWHRPSIVTWITPVLNWEGPENGIWIIIKLKFLHFIKNMMKLLRHYVEIRRALYGNIRLTVAYHLWCAKSFQFGCKVVLIWVFPVWLFWVVFRAHSRPNLKRFRRFCNSFSLKISVPPENERFKK